MIRNGMLCAAVVWRAIRQQRGLRQRLSLFAAVASTLLSVHPAGASVGRHADTTSITIHVAPNGWGDTPIEDLRFVLDAVAAEFGAHFPGRALGVIRVVPGTGAPFVFYERDTDGAYRVQLSARNARWYQFVYQFSHELCHIYSNFDNKDAPGSSQGNQWFEESLCEAAALYTLRELAARWESEPPASEWGAHAANLKMYAEHFLSEPHRRLAPTASFASWFRAHQPQLDANPYFRDKNEVVSNLLLPLFERDPGDWGAIGYLNRDRADSRKGFFEFLYAWYDACPEHHRDVVRRIMELFGTPATETAMVDSRTMQALAAP